MPSFDSWPRQLQSLADPLRRAGFHYTGCGDRVQCNACHIILHRWRVEGFEPALAHFIWSPECPYLRNVAQEIPRLPPAVRQMNAGIGNVAVYNLADGNKLTLSLPVPWLPDNPIDPDVPESDYNPDINCNVCMDAIKDVQFLPCGHASVCFSCAEKLQSFQNPPSPMPCPLCRREVRVLVPINPI